MGTDYFLFKDSNFGELVISEMSNKFTFDFIGNNEFISVSNQLSPEELVKILLNGLTICSYWMDTDKLKEMIKKHVNNEIY